MRMTDLVVLIDTVTEPNEVGIPIKTEVRREVWADELSAKSMEWYRANAAGVRVDNVFAIHADEYRGEMEVEHLGQRYTVVRSYRKGQRRVELTCAVK